MLTAEIVEIVCPHCRGTGQLPTYNCTGSKVAKQHNPCVFCNDEGRLVIRLEHGED